MGTLPKSGSIGRLPLAVATTIGVVGAPILAVVLLHDSGTLTSVIGLVAVCTVLSVAVSSLGAALWARWGSGDAVFGDLLLWGWLRRRRDERQLTSATDLLGAEGLAGGGTSKLASVRRVRLLERLGSGLEARAPDTYGHSRRVARYAAGTAKQMGLSREQVARVRRAGAVHDVGKIETPVAIMNKPGPLSDAEFEVIKRHAPVGATMVAGLGDDELTAIVRHHHERLDGNGYPDGLAAERIPLGARIIAVADTFDAVTSTRPYRAAKRHREALDLLAAEAGTQLDPDAVRAFRRYYTGLRPVAFWALALNGPRQFLPWLAGALKLDGIATTAKIGVATAATAASLAVGDVAVHALQHPASGGSGAKVASEVAPAALPGSGDGPGTAPASSDGGHSGRGVREEGEQPAPTATAPTSDETGPVTVHATHAEGDDMGGEGAGGGGESHEASGGAEPGGEGSSQPAKSVPAASKVPPPVSSVAATVGSVVESVESGSVEVPVPGLPEVRVEVPGVPPISVGGK